MMERVIGVNLGNWLVLEKWMDPGMFEGSGADDETWLNRNMDPEELEERMRLHKELKQSHVFKTEKRRGLTKPEQELLLDFLRNHHIYNHWYPIFAVMVGTGLRVGEVTGLRWCDIDLEEGIIDINHTLVYYDHREDYAKKGCYFNVNTSKTEAGKRQVPMLDFVKEAFIMERDYQQTLGIKCEVTVDGYSDFIFVNRYGATQHQGTLNKTIRRIIRDCNDAVLLKGEENPVLLPHFSYHSLRHTFTTRMCEAGVNIKVMQDTLGHADISTTLNIYADVTKELKREEFAGLDSYFKGTVTSDGTSKDAPKGKKKGRKRTA